MANDDDGTAHGYAIIRSANCRGGLKRREYKCIDNEVKSVYIGLNVGRSARVILIIVMVSAVATVLVTPDPSDDIQGLLHQPHVQISLGILCTQTISLNANEPFRPSFSSSSRSSELEDLLCVRIC